MEFSVIGAFLVSRKAAKNATNRDAAARSICGASGCLSILLWTNGPAGQRLDVFAFFFRLSGFSSGKNTPTDPRILVEAMIRRARRFISRKAAKTQRKSKTRLGLFQLRLRVSLCLEFL